MKLTEIAGTVSGQKADLVQKLIQWQESVLSLSRDLHAHPELSFKEDRSASTISELLEKGGFAVERGTAQLPTAFTATAGSGELVVAFCVEYDALPGVGHACGHNLIAGASVAAALALAPLADQLGITIKAIGTPAEEHGAGKALMLDRGAFAGVHFAMMFHPVQAGQTANPVGTGAQALGRYRAKFHGKAAHAAAAPHLGVNAADAAVLSQVAVGLLRQQLPDDQRIGIFVKEAGEVTNIIPDTAVVDFECRAFTMEEYQVLVPRVINCFEGAATATGTTLDITMIQPVYESLVQNEILANHWINAMASFGHDTSPSRGMSGGSTDMGNISQVIPSLHPWVSLPDVHDPIHSEGFAAMADTPKSYEVMFEAAAALAFTAMDVATNPEHRTHFIQNQAVPAPSRKDAQP